MLSYGHDEHGASTPPRWRPRSATAYDAPPAAAAPSVAERRAQRAEVAAAHDAPLPRRCWGEARADLPDRLEPLPGPRAVRRRPGGADPPARPTSWPPAGTRCPSSPAPARDPDLPVTLIDAGRFEAEPRRARDVNAPAASWMAEHHAYLDADARPGPGRRRTLRRGPQQQPAPPAGRDGADARGAGAHHAAHPAGAVAGVGDRDRRRAASAFAAVSRRHRARRGRTSVGQRRRAQRRRRTDLAARSRRRAGGLVGPAGAREGAARGDRRGARRPGCRSCWSGPAPDPDYFEPSASRRGSAPDAVHVGHLDHRALARLLGRRVGRGGDPGAGTSPTGWSPPRRWPAAPRSRPTPAARCPSSSTPSAGALARPGDVDDLAAAIDVARRCDRRAVRAPRRASAARLDRMVDEYEQRYARLVGRGRVTRVRRDRLLRAPPRPRAPAPRARGRSRRSTSR